MVVCKRCGKCCHFFRDKKLVACKYLIQHDKLTSCRVYANRLNKKIDKKHFCSLRENTENDFKDCPYNTNKPILC